LPPWLPSPPGLPRHAGHDVRSVVFAALAALAVWVSYAGGPWMPRTGTDDQAMAHVIATHPEFTPRQRPVAAPDEDTVSVGLVVQSVSGAALFLVAAARIRRSRRRRA